MNKEILVSLLNKAYIKASDDNKVLVETNDGSVVLKSLLATEKSKTLSCVTFESFQLQNSNIVLVDTKKLLSMLSIHDGEIDMKLEYKGDIFTKLFIDDKLYNSEFSLADPSIIEKLPSIDEPESYTLNLSLTNDFIDKFTNAKKANPETNTFFIYPSGKELIFVIGDNTNYSNKIKFSITLKRELNFKPLLFSANVFNNILSVNKSNLELFTMSLFDEGLLKLHFIENINDIQIDSEYFLIAEENI